MKSKMYREYNTHLVTDDQLEKLAADPNCSNRDECLETLIGRRARRAERLEAEETRRKNVRAELQDNPFDPRHEVSADARHIAGRIVKHLWIIFVALPFVLAILYAILTAK